MTRTLAVLGLAGALAAAWGCVERVMQIRSEPSGAPVWVDEQYVGQTPLDHRFAHYGWRRIRVGPIRDAEGKALYREKQLEVEIPAPWYETFPIDFFFEVLYPGRLTDVHALPVIELEDTASVPPDTSREAVERLRERATEFRRRALLGEVEQPPAP